MRVTREKRGNLLGIISVVLTVIFWVYVDYVDPKIGPNVFLNSPYVLYVFWPGLLVVSALFAIAAAFQGSRFWLVALLGPALEALLIWTASA